METIYGVYDSVEALTEETFRGFFDRCRPQASKERWTEIRWLGTMWEARQRAAVELTPLFIWAMNGHPFGCV